MPSVTVYSELVQTRECLTYLGSLVCNGNTMSNNAQSHTSIKQSAVGNVGNVKNDKLLDVWISLR